MATAAEFWNSVRPSGLTAEQELIAFWERMRDCPCGDHHKPKFTPTPIRRKRRRDTDDDVLMFLL